MKKNVLKRKGLNKLYKLFGISVAYRVRDEKFDRYFIGSPSNGVCVFVKRVSRFLESANRQNNENWVNNCLVASKIPKSKRKVFFVVDYLLETGGVERRLEITLDWLSERGIQPIIVTGELSYPPLRKYPCLFLNHFAPNASEKLLDLVELVRPEVVEFEMKTAELFNDVDLSNLKKYCRVGCMIHGVEGYCEKSLEQLDYRCKGASRPEDPRLRSFDLIPNVVNFSEEYFDSLGRVDRALFVSRIDREKLPTLKNFVLLCEKFELEYHIAGPVCNKNDKAVKDFIEKLDQRVFIGTIDTRDYLKTNGREYLFVAGVGQVVLESLSLNLPTLVLAHASDPLRSVFVTSKNIKELLRWNCVLKHCPESNVPGNVESFFRELSQGGGGTLKTYIKRGVFCGPLEILMPYLIST